MHDKSINTIGASAIEAKGIAPFAVTDVARSLQCIGHSDVINKSDGALSVKVQKQKAEGQAEIKSSPKESSPAERENLRRPSFQFGKMIYVLVAMPKMARQGNGSLGFVRARYHAPAGAMLDETSRGDARKWSPKTP